MCIRYFGRKLNKYTVIYGVYIRFWLILGIGHVSRVGQNHIKFLYRYIDFIDLYRYIYPWQQIIMVSNMDGNWKGSSVCITVSSSVCITVSSSVCITVSSSVCITVSSVCITVSSLVHSSSC